MPNAYKTPYVVTLSWKETCWIASADRNLKYVNLLSAF